VTVVAPIVDASWLADHPEVVLVDVRGRIPGNPAGKDPQADYEQAHLPGAVFVDVDRWLAGPPSAAEGRHPLPDPEHFAEGMRLAGIGDQDVVVAYDDDSGVQAARLVWLLRITGHAAALLDTDITGWHGPRERGVTTRPPAQFTPKPWPPEQLAQIDDLDGVPLLDARPADRYRGENEVVDVRAGHIPGAVSLPARESSRDGRLLPVPELRKRLTEVGVAPGWVSSCGSGVTACHTLLLAEHLHLAPGRLYPGSWSQWAATDRPAALGDEPG
jgi:thiosulfate/3-mercaptopyruvate sulfurtransferase